REGGQPERVLMEGHTGGTARAPVLFPDGSQTPCTTVKIAKAQGQQSADPPPAEGGFSLTGTVPRFGEARPGGRKPIAHCTKPARSTLARNPSVWNPKASEGNEPTTYALPAGSRATPFSTSIPGQFTSVDDTRFPEASYRATYPVPFPPDPSPYEPTTTASPAGSTAMPLAVSTPSVAMVRTQRVPP